MRRRASLGSYTPDPIIEFVGSYAEGLAGGPTRTFTWNGNLSGGLASSPSDGDVGFLWVSTNASPVSPSSITDWVLVDRIGANDTRDSAISLFRPSFTGTPPTGVVVTTSIELAFGVHFFRNVNSANPIAVSAETVSTINSGKVNPAGITAPNSEVFTFACGAASGSEQFQTPGNGYFLDPLTSSELDGFTLADSGGVHQTAAGFSRRVRDPAEWGGGGTDTRCSAVAITIGINPNI